jgi:hypothetical protein
MRVLISVAASLMLMLALVGPIAAAEPGPGCSDFGAMGAFLAKDWHPFGQVVSSVNHGAFAGLGFDGVGQLVQAEHSGTFGAWPCAKYATTP